MRYISNHQSAAKFIAELKSFQGSSMSGHAFAPVTTARMPREWSRVYHFMRERIVYVVKSFNTPIAWYTTEGVWYVPDVTYSGYSSRHQTYARNGAWHHLNNIGMVKRDPENYRTADEFATFEEMVERWIEGRMVPAHRKYAHVTVRGIQNGDYLQFPHHDTDGRYRTVYGKFSERGYAGKTVHYAYTMIDGKRVHTYLGEFGERVGRLR